MQRDRARGPGVLRPRLSPSCLETQISTDSTASCQRCWALELQTALTQALPCPLPELREKKRTRVWHKRESSQHPKPSLGSWAHCREEARPCRPTLAPAPAEACGQTGGYRNLTRKRHTPSDTWIWGLSVEHQPRTQCHMKTLLTVDQSHYEGLHAV